VLLIIRTKRQGCDLSVLLRHVSLTKEESVAIETACIDVVGTENLTGFLVLALLAILYAQGSSGSKEGAIIFL
jgi:hypothetical protein